MDRILPTIVFSSDLFLFVTFLGISLYLIYLFKIWQEPSIGSWAIGTLISAISILLHMVSINLYSSGYSSYDIIYRAAIFLTFLASWCFGVAHPIARRNKSDMILVSLLSIPLGFVLPSIIQDLKIQGVDGLLFERFTSDFNTFDLLNFAFYSMLFLIFARDSQIIYNASLRHEKNNYKKSIAMGHLFAWQFFAVGTGFLRYISKFLESPVYFGLPFILLLVPLLTLGSRPFDWAREGHEPVLLLLIDQFGTPTYSWTKDDQIPLFMQGSTMASISTMLEDIISNEVHSMEVRYQNYTLYTQHRNSYLSLLITTGPHKSFPTLLYKIHQILVTDSIKQEKDGLIGYSFPYELQWLLSQLIPNYDFVEEKTNSIKSVFRRSGLNFN